MVSLQDSECREQGKTKDNDIVRLFFSKMEGGILRERQERKQQ